jgi:hypothetical protein
MRAADKPDPSTNAIGNPRRSVSAAISACDARGVPPAQLLQYEVERLDATRGRRRTLSLHQSQFRRTPRLMSVSRSTDDVPTLLGTLAALSECTPSDLQLLAPHARHARFAAGTILFGEGDHHPHLYILCDGSVKLDMETARHGKQTILSMGQGDLLGWSALLADGVMTCTATVMEPTEAIVFETEALRTFNESRADVGYRFMSSIARALSRRLLATRLQLLDLYRR